MGGSTSGRWRQHVKRLTVEQCIAVTPGRMMKTGVRTFKVGQTSLTLAVCAQQRSATEWAAGIAYMDLTSHQTMTQQLSMLAVHRQVGGDRFVFLCPQLKDGIRCARHVERLYLPPLGKEFGCRLCHQLAYRSSQESHRLDSVFTGLPGMTRDILRSCVRLISRRPIELS
jgi:hypothetical protein